MDGPVEASDGETEGPDEEDPGPLEPPLPKLGLLETPSGVPVLDPGPSGDEDIPPLDGIPVNGFFGSKENPTPLMAPSQSGSSSLFFIEYPNILSFPGFSFPRFHIIRGSSLTLTLCLVNARLSSDSRASDNFPKQSFGNCSR